MYPAILGDWRPMYYGFDGKPIDFDEWIKITMGRNGRHVGLTRVQSGGHTYTVSTVLLGLDHGYGGGRPVIFETMVFKDHSSEDLEMDRYCTLAEAKAGHRRMVRQVRKTMAAHRRPLIHKGGKP